MELLKVILKQLQMIHNENLLIFATLADKDMDDEYIQKMNKVFEDTWGDLKKVNNKCNLSTCRYNHNGICRNEEKRKECVEVSKAVLCLEDLENEQNGNKH